MRFYVKVARFYIVSMVDAQNDRMRPDIFLTLHAKANGVLLRYLYH